jgi:hypothetical protein
MTARRTAEEVKANYIDKMGRELGTQFTELWYETQLLCATWGEYVELFTKSDRVKLLNQSAPALFWIIQHALWAQTLLRIARLLDPPASGKSKENLTIRNLPLLVADLGKRADLIDLVKTAESKAKFCCDWRNRHIAHRDLDLLIKKSAKPLESASQIQVTEALDSISNVLSETHSHYMGGWLTFSPNVGEAGNTLSLLRLLHDGISAREGKPLGQCPF